MIFRNMQLRQGKNERTLGILYFSPSICFNNERNQVSLCKKKQPVCFCNGSEPSSAAITVSGDAVGSRSVLPLHLVNRLATSIGAPRYPSRHPTRYMPLTDRLM